MGCISRVEYIQVSVKFGLAPVVCVMCHEAVPLSLCPLSLTRSLSLSIYASCLIRLLGVSIRL